LTSEFVEFEFVEFVEFLVVLVVIVDVGVYVEQLVLKTVIVVLIQFDVVEFVELEELAVEFEIVLLF